MNKLFVYFSTKEKFLAANQGTEYEFTTIVFIGDTKEIWNRGILYATPNDFDIADYLTKAEAANTYQPKGDYLTEHQDLSEYAKTVELQEAIKDFATRSYVDEAVAAVDVTDQLVEYAKKTEVTEEIATEIGKVEAKIPSLDGYAKETYVDGKVANVKSEILGGVGEDYDTLKEIETWVKSHGDLYEALVTTVGQKATKTELEEAVDDMATQTWVTEQNYLTAANLNGYATEEWVEGKKYLTEHQDLTEYAKSADVTEEIETSISEFGKKYYTKEEVEEMFEWGEY